MQNNLYNHIQSLQNSFTDKEISAQQIIQDIHKTQVKEHSINLDNYLYREGIFNKASALKLLKQQIKKYTKFPAKQESYKRAYNSIQHSNQKWYENYAIHQGSHNLISLNIDAWKIRSLLNCILCDIYVGSSNEDTDYNLMKED